MLALLTSCGRFDLLTRTLESLYNNQASDIFVIIHEDGKSRYGQHASIDKFLRSNNVKYYLHLEDDWEFNNTYNWIAESIKIMESDQSIIKVICRSDSPHPCEFNNGFGILKPWIDPWKSHEWHGFGWNPGITRLDLLKQFLPLPKTEQEISKIIYDAGYRTALLEKGACRHIGEERSTHEN